MIILLVFHNDREGTPQPFLPERIRARGLGSNVQLFHRTPPSLILREEPENGETSLSAHISLQLLHLCLDHQVDRFMGCDCHIEVFFRVLKQGCQIEQ